MAARRSPRQIWGMGALCIFLCDMGMEADKRLSEFKKASLFLVGFGVVMPLDRRVFRASARSFLPALLDRRCHLGAGHAAHESI